MDTWLVVFLLVAVQRYTSAYEGKEWIQICTVRVNIISGFVDYLKVIYVSLLLNVVLQT